MGSRKDVIVVGAGLGGLVAAARLVQAGCQVLVLDRNPHVAGTAWVFNRAGFSFPMGPLGFSGSHLVQKTISELVPGAELSLKRVHYRLRAFGLNLPLSLSRPALRAALSRIFPQEAQGITRFFEKVESLFNLLREPCSEKNRIALEAAANEPAREYLDTLIGDWRLRRVLGSQGGSEAYAALPLLAAMWGLMTEEGIWYPARGADGFGRPAASGGPFCEGPGRDPAGVGGGGHPDSKGTGDRSEADFRGSTGGAGGGLQWGF